MNLKAEPGRVGATVPVTLEKVEQKLLIALDPEQIEKCRTLSAFV